MSQLLQSHSAVWTVSFEQMQAQPRCVACKQGVLPCPSVGFQNYRHENLSWGTHLPHGLPGIVLQVHLTWSIKYCWETGMSLDPKQPRGGIPSDLQDGVRVGLCQCVPPIAKMGPWTNGAILTNKPSLQTSQELDFHVIQSPAASQQRMFCCQGARVRMIKWGLLGHIQCQQHLMVSWCHLPTPES